MIESEENPKFPLFLFFSPTQSIGKSIVAMERMAVEARPAPNNSEKRTHPKNKGKSPLLFSLHILLKHPMKRVGEREYRDKKEREKRIKY